MSDTDFVPKSFGFPPESYRTEAGVLLVISEVQAIYPREEPQYEGELSHYVQFKGQSELVNVELTSEDQTKISRIINWYYNESERNK